MRNYWLTQEFLALAGWSYLLLCVLAFGLSVYLPRRISLKVLLGATTLVLASLLPLEGYQEHQADDQAAVALRELQRTAAERFREKCATAGEKIYRTVSGVKGFGLLKIREKTDVFSRQFERNDPYGWDYAGDGYIESMLWGRDAHGHLQNSTPAGAVYEYVEFRIGTAGKWMEARPVWDAAGREMRLRIVDATQGPKYAVTFEDISSTEDREHWIAGSSLRIVDTESGEVIAERTGWMWDPGQGSRDGWREPWLMAAATACPRFPLIHGQYPHQLGQTRNFVEKVLKP